MRKVLKTAANFILIPAVRWYLRKERSYRYKNSIIKIFPGVFHPGLFHSTRFLLAYLEGENLKDKRVLELGCGSGLISIQCAKQGAYVTAIDLSKTAIENTVHNSVANGVTIETHHSNLFENIKYTVFDWIIINPPYYAKDATSDEELAWNCGEGFQYFKNLFIQLPQYINKSSSVIMVLTKGCDIGRIIEIGNEAGFTFNLKSQKKVFFDEMDYIYRIEVKAFA